MLARTILTAAAIVALLVWFATFLASNARADVLVNGKVHQTTADKVIAQRQLVCSYGKTRFEATPDGRTVVIMGKVCTEVSGKR